MSIKRLWYCLAHDVYIESVQYPLFSGEDYGWKDVTNNPQHELAAASNGVVYTKLLFHPESESYFRSDKYTNEMASQGIEDVTGIEAHELSAFVQGVKPIGKEQTMPVFSPASQSHAKLFNSPTKEQAEIKRAYRDSAGDAIKAAIVRHLHPETIVTSCLSCRYFSEHGIPETGRPAETCDKFKAKPPARIIAFGCPSYEDIDEIPF